MEEKLTAFDFMFLLLSPVSHNC